MQYYIIIFTQELWFVNQLFILTFVLAYERKVITLFTEMKKHIQIIMQRLARV